MQECQRCHELGEDRRTISMSCLYDMDELGIPFKHKIIQNTISGNNNNFYTLTVCKQCRGSWMEAQVNWFNGVDNAESCGSGIYIREYGAVKEITEEEWYERNPDITPVGYKKQ
jgi:hypothetical protein